MGWTYPALETFPIALSARRNEKRFQNGRADVSVVHWARKPDECVAGQPLYAAVDRHRCDLAETEGDTLYPLLEISFQRQTNNGGKTRAGFLQPGTPGLVHGQSPGRLAGL